MRTTEIGYSQHLKSVYLSRIFAEPIRVLSRSQGVCWWHKEQCVGRESRFLLQIRCDLRQITLATHLLLLLQHLEWHFNCNTAHSVYAKAELITNTGIYADTKLQHEIRKKYCCIRW